VYPHSPIHHGTTTASCVRRAVLVRIGQLFGFSSHGLWSTTRRINAVSVAAHAKNSAGKFAFFDSDDDVDAQNKKERD